MKQISLTRGLVALVDDEDYESLSKHKWYARKNKHTFYASRNKRLPKKTQYDMHRVILCPEEGMQVDHIDGNGLNNQKSNLRIVSHRQNSQNRHFGKTSAYPGVSKYKHNNRWQARIKVKGKDKYIGCFSNENDAAVAYRVACVVLGVGCI